MKIIRFVKKKNYVALNKEDKKVVLQAVNLMVSLAYLYFPEKLGNKRKNDMLLNLLMKVPHIYQDIIT